MRIGIGRLNYPSDKQTDPVSQFYNFGRDEGRGMIMAEKLTLEICKERLATINPKIKITATEYLGATKPLPCICLVCNHPWSPNWNNISKPNGENRGCPKCGRKEQTRKRQMPNDDNRLSFVRPDLVKYFKYPEQANEHTYGSGRTVDGVCPDCGYEKPIRINDLQKDGYGCPQCSCGISVPNRFVFSVLSQLKLNFTPEKVFAWEKDRKYDFYLPDLNMIIEVHGGFHYAKDCWNKKLSDVQDNDLYKEMIAKANDINHYVAMDARHSDLEYLKNSTIETLSNYFDLSDIVWEDVYKYCTNSIMAIVWKMYDSGIAIEEISKEFKMVRQTTQRYLKIGAKLGKTKYSNKDNHIKVAQYTLEGVFVAEFKSQAEASRQTGISESKIGQVCLNKRKSAGKHIWRNVD